MVKNKHLQYKPSPPPRHLSSAAKRLWRELVSEFDISDAPGRIILTAGLEAYDRAASAKELLDGLGVAGAVVVDRYGQMRAHPAASIERTSRAAFLNALKQLNLGKVPARPGPGRPGGGVS